MYKSKIKELQGGTGKSTIIVDFNKPLSAIYNQGHKN